MAGKKIKRWKKKWRGAQLPIDESVLHLLEEGGFDGLDAHEAITLLRSFTTVSTRA